MAGYNHFEGKSNNYLECEEQDDVLKGMLAVKYLKKNYGIKISAKTLEEKCRWSEWHHASKMYNKIYFYDTEILKDFGKENQGTDFESGINEGKKITVLFDEWVGSKNNWSKKEVVYIGTIKGNWLILDNKKKKNMQGNGFIKILETN